MTRRARPIVGVLAGVGMSVVIACGAARPMPSSSSSAPASASADPHVEIAELERRIAADRAQLGMPAESDASPIAPVAPVAPCEGAGCPHAVAMTANAPGGGSAVDPSCHPAKTETCTTSCTLSGSICDDAAKICTLAQQLPGDAGAATSCTRGQASCTDSHARCCGCTL